MEDLELAWAAGFFDGEGCISVRKEKRLGKEKRPGKGRGRDRVSLTVVINHCEPQPLERFFAAVGLGTIIGPITDNKRPNHQPYYRWCTHSTTVGLEVMEKLLPFLSDPKRNQMDRKVVEMNELSEFIVLNGGLL